MEHINHHETTHILNAAKGLEDICSNLPVKRSQYFEKPMITSYWKPTQDELNRLICGHAIVLDVLSDRMPPVRMCVEEPVMTEASTTELALQPPRCCGSCQRYVTSSHGYWIGECGLDLPKHVKTTGSRTTRSDDTCSLHLPI